MHPLLVGNNLSILIIRHVQRPDYCHCLQMAGHILLNFKEHMIRHKTRSSMHRKREFSFILTHCIPTSLAGHWLLSMEFNYHCTGVQTCSTTRKWYTHSTFLGNGTSCSPLSQVRGMARKAIGFQSKTPQELKLTYLNIGHKASTFLLPSCVSVSAVSGY